MSVATRLSQPAPDPANQGASGFVRHDRFTIPLSPPGPLQFYLDTLLVPHSRSELVRAVLARSARSLAPLLGAQACPANTLVPLETLAAELRQAGLIGGAASAIVLGDYGDSARGKAVAFVFDGAAAQPAVVAKLCSAPDHASALEHEHAVLNQLRARLDPGLAATLPRPLAPISLGPMMAWCQAWLPGKAIHAELRNSLAPRQLVQGHFVLVGTWLGRFQQATRSGQTSLGACGALPALRAFAGANPALSSPALALVAAAIRRGEELADEPLPLVGSHGDFWGRNLLVGGNGLSVIDWESARDQGLPSDDLFHFLVSYGQSFPWQLGRWADPRQAFAATFTADGWMSSLVDAALQQHCRRSGISPHLLGVLFPAFLAERALRQGGIWAELFEIFAGSERCACFGC